MRQMMMMRIISDDLVRVNVKSSHLNHQNDHHLIEMKNLYRSRSNLEHPISLVENFQQTHRDCDDSNDPNGNYELHLFDLRTFFEFTIETFAGFQD